MEQSEFNQVLVDLVGPDIRVYFQPPANIQMVFPCVRYERGPADTGFAGDKPYRVTKRYTVTLISSDPETDVWDKLAGLPMSSHQAFFVADNLNHDVFDIFA